MAVDYTATIDGKDYGFDFEDTRIDVDATIDSLDVGNLYDAIQDAQYSEAGMAYGTIANGEGLATLSTGIKTFLTVTLLGTWEVSSLKTSGKFEVSGGNLIRADGADPFRDNPLITYIAFLSQAGILAEGGSSGLTPEESAILSTLDTLVDELHKLQGLDASNPMTVTPTSRVAGTISQAITGDGSTVSTVTRV